VDVDSDGVTDPIRVEALDTIHHIDEDPCAGCGDHRYGHFEAVVALSGDGRTVRSKRIEVVPGGFRFRDYGNAPPGWLTTTCLWDADRKEFRCSGTEEPPP